MFVKEKYDIKKDYVVYDKDGEILFNSYNEDECQLYLKMMQKADVDLQKTSKENLLNKKFPDNKYTIVENGETVEKINVRPTLKEASEKIVNLIINNPTLPVICNVEKVDDIKYGKYYEDTDRKDIIQQTLGAILTKAVLYHDVIFTDEEELYDAISDELYDKLYEDGEYETKCKNIYMNNTHAFVEKMAKDIIKKYKDKWTDVILIIIEY